MSKGTSNLFDSAAWFGQWQGWHNWGGHPKPPSSPSTPSSGGSGAGGSTGPITTLTVTFQSEEAGYASAMGWYNARTGEAGILFKNTNDDGCNAGVKAGDSRSLTVLQSDVDANNIGFFLIPNGANELSNSLLSSQMKFQVGSSGNGKIVIDRQWGHDVVLSGSDVLFSNQVHNKGDFDYVSGTVGTAGQTRQQKMGAQSDGPDGILGTMAWDDQSMNGCGGTDRDFNDVVFKVTKSGGTKPPTNSAPTDITLSAATISENVAGGVIGMLSTVDPNAGDTHTYSVSDNRFEVVNGQLKLNSGVSLDYETESSVQLKVTTTDQGGLGYSEDFTIQVKDLSEPTNAAPTGIMLNGGMVTENVIGAVVGTLATTDPDVGDTHTYTVDDNRFEVVGNQLRLKSGVSLDFEDDSSFAVNVTTTDQGGLSYSDNFFISVKNVNEAPTDISISNLSVNENAVGAVIGKLSTIDPDARNTHTYTVSDNRFEVVNGELKLIAGQSLDYETESSVQLNITTKDQGGLSYFENFTVKVKDVDETPPNSAPTDIALSGGTITEHVAGAVVGAVITTDPNVGDTHTYKVDDDRFEVVGGQLKLKSGLSLDYDVETNVVVNITTTDKGGLSYAESFTIAVADGNDPPTEINISNVTIPENEAGIGIGSLMTIDPNPGDTHTYTVSDDRFEVVGDLLKLKNGISLDFDTTPSVVVTVTSTDKGGLSFSTDFTIHVEDSSNGSGGSGSEGGSSGDTFLFDLSMGLTSTLVGFDAANDVLSFTGVFDADSNGVDLNDLLSMVLGVGDFGSGADVVVEFTSGTSLVFQGAGTPGGNVDNLTALVANPSTQIHVA